MNTNEFNQIIPCISELSSFKKTNNPVFKQKIITCLSKYGDIYKKLNIELYTNPKTNKIYFPDNQRIQSNFNIFLEDIDLSSESPKLDNLQLYNLQLYNILLHDALRNIYNESYPTIKQNAGKKRNSSKRNKSKSKRNNRKRNIKSRKNKF